jgi:ketosteroid isomerase-like protein
MARLRPAMRTELLTKPILGGLLALLAVAAAQAEPTRAERLDALAREVSAAERDFAKTMSDRDLQAFAGFVAEDAVFRSGHDLQIGRAAVVEGWRDNFKPGPAPFSWEPDRVTVAASADTAVSSGPVRDPAGRVIGRFTTIWHKDAAPGGAGRWRVIADQGVPLLECSSPGK